LLCNFQITGLVEFAGEFGRLDVHNAYDLERVEVDISRGSLVLGFEGNQWRSANGPKAFQLCVEGLDQLEMTARPEDFSDFVINEIGFMNAADREYQYGLIDQGQPRTGAHLVFKTGHGVIRFAAERAYIFFDEKVSSASDAVA
jgi:hypothetical protein